MPADQAVTGAGARSAQAASAINERRYDMTYDEFKSLSEDEQRASYIESAALDDLTAERDSFKAENESLNKQLKELQEEHRKTKEMNYTLSRRIAAEPKKSAEEILNEMFK